jgi:hypothetical protein
MRRYRTIPLYVLSMTLLACGGGGGGGSDTSFLGGVYQGPVAITDNPCGVPLASGGTVDWTVNQDSTRVVLDASSGATYEGAVTSDTSFAVSNETTSQSCTTSTNIVISNITSSSGHADVAISNDCLAQCTVKASASLTRSGGKVLLRPTDRPTDDIINEIVEGFETRLRVQN